MNKVFRFLVFTLVIAALVVPFAAVGAQSTRTLVVTEQQINDSFRVTNPARMRVSNIVVDLQAGQAVVSATYTTRNQSYNATAVITPSVVNGRAQWQVSSINVSGQSASQDLINQINTSIQTSWRNYARQQAGTGRLQSITVTDSDITFTYTGR